MKKHILIFCIACMASVVRGAVLEPDSYKAVVDQFNADDPEPFKQDYPNQKAWEFMRENIPLLDCPDPEVQRTYYFRWWTFRKHLQKTPEGWVITEFLPKVSWGHEYNTINCAAGHHIQEGRWLKDHRYVEDYIRFWLQKGHRGNYSSWLPYAVWNYCITSGNDALAVELLPALVKHYQSWESEKRDTTGLYWQTANLDGMEGPIGGHGYRPTINSYMYGNAMAIAQIARKAGKNELAEEYQGKAAAIKNIMQQKLWNPAQQFFEVRKGPASMGLFGWRVNNDADLTRQAKPALSVKQNPEGLNGGANPPHSWDWKYPHVMFRMGTEEWMEYAFPKPVEISSTQLFLMRGGTFDFPESFRLLYRDNGEWKEVNQLKGAIDQYDRWNALTFAPVTTDGLRLELRMAGFTRDALPMRNVRELLGYVPWYFNLPDPQYTVAWQQITDPKGFAAPWGLTTAEQRHPDFKIRYDGHECLWNGPVWPFATAQTLTAMANLLNDYQQDVVDRRNYFEALHTYARSHQLTRPDGKVIPWIDEDQNPFTGDWIARTCILGLEKTKPQIWQKKGGTSDRGKDYNHSTFCDLVINGLIGLRPQADNKVVVNPLVPENQWDWFCLDRVPYHGHMLTILWDKTGQHYGKGAGLRIFADNKEIARGASLSRLEGAL